MDTEEARAPTRTHGGVTLRHCRERLCSQVQSTRSKQLWDVGSRAMWTSLKHAQLKGGKNTPKENRSGGMLAKQQFRISATLRPRHLLCWRSPRWECPVTSHCRTSWPWDSALEAAGWPFSASWIWGTTARLGLLDFGFVIPLQDWYRWYYIHY